MSIASKLTYLNNTKQLLKDGINDLGGNIDNETTFREYVNALENIYNDYPKVSNSGTSINLTNTKQGKITSELNSSELSQESTTGAQLYNYQDTLTVDTKWSSDGNGWLSCTGNNTTSSTSYANYFTNNLNLNTSTNYLAVMEVETVSGSGSLSLFTDGGQATTNKNISFASLSNNTTYVYSFTTKSSFEGVTQGLRSYCRFAVGDEGTIKCRISVIADTTVTPETFIYQSFTGGIPAPNPSYPFPIHTISGENNIKIESKNLLNLNLPPIYRNSANASFNEPNIEIIKTVASTNNFCLFSVGETSILNGKTLLFTGNLLSEQSRAIVGYADANGQNRVTIDGSGIDISSGNFQRTITVDGTTYANKNVVIWLYSDTSGEGASGDKAIFKNVMVSESGGNYVPHQKQNYSINLGDLEYCEIGTYPDKIFKNTSDDPNYDSGLNENEWYMKKNIKKVVLNGTENWKYGTGNVFYADDITDYATSNNVPFSNYFKGISNVTGAGDSAFSSNDNVIAFINVSGGTTPRLYINSSSFNSNVTTLKTWLTTHNVIVYYITNGASHINISQNYETLTTQLENLKNNAKSYDDETNISQTNNDLPFDITAYALEKGE